MGIMQFHVQQGLNLTILGEYVPPLLDNGTATIVTIQGKVLRAYGTMPHPNVYAGFLTIILSFWLYVSRETSSIKQWVIVSCGTFVLWWGLLVSFSRSGWLTALFVSLAYLGYFIFNKAYKQAMICGFILLVSCGTLALFYKDFVFPRSVDVGVKSQAVQYRKDFNTYGINSFKHNILGGIGVNQYIPAMERSLQLEPWEYQPPHNILILYLAELGLIGLFIALLTLCILGFTWNNSNILSFTLLAAIIILGGLDHYLLTIQQGFLLLAICLGLTLLNKKDVSQS
jgi:hypothetical protein